jgi:hypothetical protein
MVRLGSLLVFTACLCACASESQRYAWNSQHARVHRSVRLPQSEVDQIIRTVSAESIFPIVVISREQTPRSDQIIVWTDAAHDPQSYMTYELERHRDGLWHIVSRQEGSIIILDERQ